MAKTANKTSLQEKLHQLHDYSACDVSDALLKLQKPVAGEVARAGHLADIISMTHSSAQTKVIAPARTLKLISKHLVSSAPAPPEGSEIPKGSHWVDMTEAGSIMVIDQPEGQKCAAVGGIMATRMKVCGVAGVVVGGRVRDLAELKESGLPIFAHGKSTVGTGAEATPWARNIPISIAGVPVCPGDIIFCDSEEGVVVIPQALLDEVLELMPKLIAADEKVKEAVSQGMTVAEAFKTFR